ncbi:MAG: cupin domain-containing protein [Actinomycetota bacterium]
MELALAAEEPGIQVLSPYSRSIKVLFAPDRSAVTELMFSVVSIDPGSQTDYHVHDRPELIYVVSGDGSFTVDDKTVPIAGETALYVRTGEWHQLRSTGPDPLKLATVFVPPYTAEENYDRCLSAARSAASA